MEKVSGIYKITSKIKPERVYMGSAVNINKRWNTHLFDLRKNKHHSSKLQRHYNKYGEFDLVFSIIVTCEKEELIKEEQIFMYLYKPYFNTCKIAGSTLGHKHSEESRRKMGVSGIGHIPWNKGLKNCYNEETIKKMGDSKRGICLSEETKRKLSGRIPWNKGLVDCYSEETRKQISNSLKGITSWNKGKHFSEESRRKMSVSKMGKIPWNKGISKYGKNQISLSLTA